MYKRQDVVCAGVTTAVQLTANGITECACVPANVEGYDIGAKTGTAEKLPRDNGKYLLSYVGYAPQENPEILIYVVIDEPNVDAQDDSCLLYTSRCV